MSLKKEMIISKGEKQFRSSLGIPDDAEKVLLFSESSHWDPNWLYTSEKYFLKFVQNNLNQALMELEKEPGRVYSIECIFFLRKYWDSFPAKRKTIQKFINNRQLRLTGTGVTTADTLLPDSEAILRDFLIGQQWLRENGMEQEPRLAYFTDSFGCTPALPSLLNAAGFDRTALTRIDGMYFMGCDLESSGNFPRKGSSAEVLLKNERSLDFVWRDRNGAELLSHWNAFTYGQGDMLSYRGISRVYLARLAFPARSEKHIARRIKHYASQLSPVSRTPYMLCPIGFDFVEPIPDIVYLLDRYNKNYYPKTGIWAINAGIDDYLSLVEYHKDKLPVLQLDPNPYWTGFYTARPNLKKHCHNLVDDLILAEKLSFLPENIGDGRKIARALDSPWWTGVVSNHHDFITGTSPDSVVQEEQIPWLIHAEDKVKGIINRITPDISRSDSLVPSTVAISWKKQKNRIQIKNSWYTVEFDEDAGGAIVSFKLHDGQVNLLTGISNDLVSYRDSGGLWRMGFEFAGGIWKESECASRRHVSLQVRELENGLEIVGFSSIKGENFERKVWLNSSSPIIHFQVKGKAPKGHSVTVRFRSNIHTGKLIMDTPGGVSLRPLQRIYTPTFWPLHCFVHFQDDRRGYGLAVVQPLPGAVSCKKDGLIELVAMRNATREKILGLIGIPGNPARGSEQEKYVYNYSLFPTSSGDWQENKIFGTVHSIKDNPWISSRVKALGNLADSIIKTVPEDIQVTAVKQASRGEGIIVRLYVPVVPEEGVVVGFQHIKITEAFLCDSMERDIKPLEVLDDSVHVKMSGTVTTIRFISNNSGWN